MSDKDKSNEEFYDLCYDVWKSGGNPDRVDPDRFYHDYYGEYDSWQDSRTLKRELKHQGIPKKHY